MFPAWADERLMRGADAEGEDRGGIWMGATLDGYFHSRGVIGGAKCSAISFIHSFTIYAHPPSPQIYPALIKRKIKRESQSFVRSTAVVYSIRVFLTHRQDI